MNENPTVILTKCYCGCMWFYEETSKLPGYENLFYCVSCNSNWKMDEQGFLYPTINKSTPDTEYNENDAYAPDAPNIQVMKQFKQRPKDNILDIMVNI